MLHYLRTTIRGLFQRRRVARELDEEVQFHLEMEYQANLARGMSPAAGRHHALLQLGGMDQTKEAVRDIRATWLDSVWQDLRFAWRTLCRAPSYSIGALATLALGIGTTTAMFSVADAVALKPLPYHRQDRLVGIHSRDLAHNRISTAMAPRDFLAWRDRQRVFQALGAAGGGAYKLTEGEPEELRGVRMTGDVFTALGVKPLLGRMFGRTHETEGNNQVVVLAHGFWQRRFGGAADILGRRISLDNQSYEIIGVMPPEFKYPPLGKSMDIWVPMTFDADDRSNPNPFLDE